MEQFAPRIGKCPLRCLVKFSVFRDPSRKSLSENDFIGDGNVLQTLVISAIEEVGHRFSGNLT